MNERLKLLRRELGLNQKELGERIKLSQTHISSLENGAREMTDRILADICREFNINDNWLRNNEGPMFIESDSMIISELAHEYQLDDLDKKIIEHYVKMDSQHRTTIKNYVLSLAAQISGMEETAASTNEDDIEAELESYRRELEAEKKRKMSSALPKQKESS